MTFPALIYFFPFANLSHCFLTINTHLLIILFIRLLLGEGVNMDFYKGIFIIIIAFIICWVSASGSSLQTMPYDHYNETYIKLTTQQIIRTKWTPYQF